MANDRKTALITGAGQNIGKACALALARNGFNIVINGRSKREQCDDVADQVQRMGPDALVAMGDVGSREGCEAVVKPALDRFGRIDVMVHNADRIYGVFAQHGKSKVLALPMKEKIAA